MKAISIRLASCPGASFALSQMLELCTDSMLAGMDLDKETSTLYVVNHAQGGSCIETFQLELTTKTLTYIQTIKHPLLHAPNSIESVGGGRLYVTNDHMFRARASPVLSKIETFSGLPGGTVVHFDINTQENSEVVARVPFANGIAKVNATTLAVASSSKAGVYLYEMQPDHSLKFKDWFRTPAAVDNLSVSDRLQCGNRSKLIRFHISGRFRGHTVDGGSPFGTRTVEG